MSRAPVRSEVELAPESDRFSEIRHPRDTYSLFGHLGAEQKLLAAFRNRKLAHSWIIGGREGIGKATLAWRFARFVLAHPDPGSETVRTATDLYVDQDLASARRVAALSHGDLILLRREWNTKISPKKHFTEIRVDDVRAAITRFQRSTSESGWRVCIVDCTDDLNRNAANALLKLVEEPPPRSLFLFIAHKPANVLATIRSRSQMLQLAPLSKPNVAAAIGDLGAPWNEASAEDMARAAERAGGSVRDTLRYLDSGIAVLGQFDAIMEKMPAADWRAIHKLVDVLCLRTKTEEFEFVLAAVFDWISARLHHDASAPSSHPVTLAPLADLWDKIATSTRQIEALNLDRRAFLITMFSDLADVARPPSQ